jgi:hypothetical protein
MFCRLVKQHSMMLILDEVEENNTKVSQKWLDLLKYEKVDFVYLPVSSKKQKNAIFS